MSRVARFLSSVSIHCGQDHGTQTPMQTASLGKPHYILSKRWWAHCMGTMYRYACNVGMSWQVGVRARAAHTYMTAVHVRICTAVSELHVCTCRPSKPGAVLSIVIMREPLDEVELTIRSAMNVTTPWPDCARASPLHPVAVQSERASGLLIERPLSPGLPSCILGLVPSCSTHTHTHTCDKRIGQIDQQHPQAHQGCTAPSAGYQSRNFMYDILYAAAGVPTDLPPRTVGLQGCFPYRANTETPGREPVRTVA
jgi:hypothetical protein